jgi:carboxymethylenebutenolidase
MKKFKNSLLALSVFLIAAFAGGCEAESITKPQPSMSGLQTMEIFQTQESKATETKTVYGLGTQENTAVRSETVKYYGNTQGFYAEPVGKGTYPGVIMVHEWWGLNENIKGMAKKLAGEGYKVLAVDLYGGKIAASLDEAKKMSAAIDQPENIKNMQAAASYLGKKGVSKIAVLGWCFGGGQALQLALSGEKLDAAVMYYGQPVTDKEKLAAIKSPLLGIFAGSDTVVSLESVKEFSDALTEDGIKSNIYVYPVVGHAFANPTGTTYAPQQTLDAWQKTLNFLAENLK